jgi:DNA-directed RNA polymerase specialized sigma24 family protein
VGGKGATPTQLEALYRARFGHFVRVAVAICGDRERGRDVVQNAFIAAIRHRRSFRGDAPLEAWVWRIVVNEARRAAAEPPLGLTTQHDESMNGHGGDELDPLGIRGWIIALPDRQREAIFLRYFADLDYATIAEALGIEIGTVSATLGAAHRSLRKTLQEVRP